MGVNNYRRHVYVLPEDDANRQLAIEFVLGLPTGQIKVLAPAGGWNHVLESFQTDQAYYMRRFPDRFMVLLIDFDKHDERSPPQKAKFPTT